MIPDVPLYIHQLIQRELHLAKEARYEVAFEALHQEHERKKRESLLIVDESMVTLTFDDNAPPSAPDTVVPPRYTEVVSVQSSAFPSKNFFGE